MSAERETVCSGCIHCRICAHKNDHLNMIKRLEEVYYSVPEEDRAIMAFADPDCKYYQGNPKPLCVPDFGSRVSSDNEKITKKAEVRS